ncbi:MAG: CpsB/CapC family capsule biosynthesis tyrosine phosphatase [Planctomycetota bacterium]
MIGDDEHFDWQQPQLERLAAFGVSECVDVHCHILPGIDDGPADLSQALALCLSLVDDGITTVIATPHQLGRYDRENSAEVVAEKIDQLCSALAAEQIPLRVLPGGDVRIDERLDKFLDQGEVISLGGCGGHLLIELPHELFVDPIPAIKMLRDRSLQAIMTHPERHSYLADREDLLQDWVRRGAVIQLTAGSLLGDFGRRAHRQAWRIVEAGLASLVATDAHDAKRRPPRLSAALAMLSAEMGDDVARSLCIENPLRVLSADQILPIPAMSADA